MFSYYPAAYSFWSQRLIFLWIIPRVCESSQTCFNRIFFRPTKMYISKPKGGVPNLLAQKILYNLVRAFNIRRIFSSKKPNLLMLLWTQKLVDFSLRFWEDNLLKLWITTYDMLVTPTRQILCFKLVVLYSKCWIVPSPPPGPPPISCLGRICNVYTWVIGKRNANTVPSKFMLHNIEKPTWSLPRDLLFTVSFLFMKPQHISFIWYAGEGGPGHHEEGRPSALLNIGHQSQTWLWYFFKLWYFETFIRSKANPVKLWKILHCPPSKGCRSKQKENTG